MVRFVRRWATHILIVADPENAKAVYSHTSWQNVTISTIIGGAPGSAKSLELNAPNGAPNIASVVQD
jgi:hypothetical protein